MSKKPVMTLLQTAAQKASEPEKCPLHAALSAPVPEARSPYAALVADMPGDPDAKTFLLEQLEVSRSWGNSMIRVPSELLLAILDKALKA